MKLSGSILSIIIILLLSTLVASATSSEMSGGMGVVANNGGALSGISTPTSTSLQLGDSIFTRDFNEGEIQGFAALFANDDNTLGTVSAVRYSTSSPGAPAYATLDFKAPSKTSMNILLKQSTRPSTITNTQFTDSIKAAGNTWNTNGVVNRVPDVPFFGSVSDASTFQRAQANDGKFVHSFSYSSGNWLAGNWFTVINSELKDSDVIYNKRYKFSTNLGLVSDATKRYVDLQTVALHELGHNVGLDDIYNKQSLWWDESEVMNDYHWGVPKRILGAGDKNGLMAIYG